MSSLHDLGGGSNASDFDNSDDDIASLLADDDDDIFAKKAFGNSSPKKVPSGQEIGTSKELEHKSKPDSQTKNTLSKNSPKHTLSKNNSKVSNDGDEDALNAFLSESSLPSFLEDSKKFSPIKKDAKKSIEKTPQKSKFSDVLSKSSTNQNIKSKASIDDNDEDILKSLESEDKISGVARKERSGSFFDDFLKNLSPKTSPKKSISELSDDIKGDDSDDDDDLLKSLESDEAKDPPSPRKRSGSFFDDFLKNISPKHSAKKPTTVAAKTDNDNKQKDSEEDVLGKLISSPTKSNSTIRKNHTLEKRRESLQKQVSFKGIPETIAEEKIVENKNPIKEKISSPAKILPEKSEVKAPNKSISQPKRSERMGATNKEDTDWLNFFKESPKKIIKPKEPQSKSEDISSKIPFSDDDFKHNANRRRSSSADWLGLSEAKSIPSNDLQISKENKLSVEDDEWMVETEAVQIPFTSPRRRQKIEDSQAVDTDWLTDRNTSSIGRNKNPSKSPHILKDHLPEGSLSDINRMKASIEAENLQQTNIPKESRISSAQLQFGKAESSFQTVLSDNNRNKFADLNSQAAFKDSYAPRNLSNDSGIKTESLKEADASIHALQTIINNHILEKDQLLKSSEAIKLMYEERIKTLEMLQKDQLKESEDSFKVMETKLKSEIEEKVKNYEEKLNAVEQEKKSLEQNVKAKQEEIGKENLKEIKRLKELHEQSITLMKQDHEEALLRLKRLKEQEIEALLSTQSHSKSLQHLTEQLEARTAELASLQVKLEDRNQATMRDKQALLDAKERDLRSLQNRLQKQLENSDDERDRLQQLVLKLESRLQKYAAEGEEDRWEVQQMKARLSVQQKHLDEEYKLQMQQVEREKEKLRLSQDSLLHEQKVILVQLAQERQQLMQEKVEMESLSKKIKEEETKFHIKVLKEESFIEKQKQFIQQEQNKMNFEKTSAKQELQFFEQEKDALLMERQMLKEEKIKLNELNYKLRRRENELEIMLMAATDDKERGQAEHTAALKIKAEQQSREQQITQKMQELMEKEHQILSEKEKLTEERLELEKKKNSVLCNKCKLSLGHPIHAPTTSVHYAPVSTTPISTPFLNGISNPLVPQHPDPSLVVWYITAQKDREFLKEELSFLKSLKESSNKESHKVNFGYK